MRGGAATEGLELLQRGCEVIKFSQKGKPSVILLRLSADEKELSWHRHGLSKLKLKTERRALQVEGITDLLVGRESAVFQKQRAGLGSAAAEAEALFAGLAEDEQNAEDEADALFRRASRGVDIADEDEERVAEHLRRGLALADGGLQLAEDLFAEQQTAAAVNTNPFGQSTAHAKPNRRTAEEAAADLFGSAAPTAAGPSRRPKATNPFGADASPPSENPFGAPASSRRSSRGPSNPFGAPASRQAASGGTKNPFAEAPPAAETAEEAAARLMAEIDGI